MKPTPRTDESLRDCADEGLASASIVAALRALRPSRERDVRRAIEALLDREVGR